MYACRPCSMPLKTNSLQSHRQLLEGSAGATALSPRVPSPLQTRCLGGVLKTSRYPTGTPHHPGASSKEDLVLDKAGVGDRKLALKLDRLERESRAHMRMREREEKQMRQVCRDIRRHRDFDDSAVGRKADSAGGANRLLPPIPPPPDSGPRSIRQVRSTPNSPVNNRRACSGAGASRGTATPGSNALAIPDSGIEGAGLRVRSAGPGLAPAALHHRSRSASNLPGAAGASNPTRGAPAITVYAHKEDGRKRQSSPELSDSSPANPPPRPHSPSSPTVPSSSKQRAWERGLTPARRARSPAELAKVQGSVSYLAPSVRGALRSSKSEDNLSSALMGRSAEDPRFQKLTSCLVETDTSSAPLTDECQEDRDDRGRSSSVEALNQEMVAIRITSSTPTLPPSRRNTGRHQPVPPLAGHLREPGGALPPLKAHNPRAVSPRILINNAGVSSGRLDGQRRLVTEETVELDRVNLAGVGAGPKELLALDAGRLSPNVSGEEIRSPPFYGKAHNPDWLPKP